MELSSSQPDELSSHSSVCMHLCICVCVCEYAYMCCTGVQNEIKKEGMWMPHSLRAYHPHILPTCIRPIHMHTSPFSPPLLFFPFFPSAFSPPSMHKHTHTHTYYLSPTHAHMPKKKLVTQGQSLSLLPIDSSRGYIVICYQPWSNKMEQREHTPSHTNS